MNFVKEANIVVTTIHGCTDKRYSVRTGKQGDGNMLYSCTAMNNPIATSLAYGYCVDWLNGNGYRPLDKNGRASIDQFEGDYWSR